MEKVAAPLNTWTLAQERENPDNVSYAREATFHSKNPQVPSANSPNSRLNLEIIRKYRRWHLLKGKIIELVIEFTDSQTGKIKSRGKVFYRVRKKQFYYTISDIKISFSSIHFCLKNYREDMEKILYARFL